MYYSRFIILNGMLILNNKYIMYITDSINATFAARSCESVGVLITPNDTNNKKISEHNNTHNAKLHLVVMLISFMSANPRRIYAQC